MKTASSEIRAIAVKAYDAGISRQQIADIVGYHLNSVGRWIREFERENRLEATSEDIELLFFQKLNAMKLLSLLTNSQILHWKNSARTLRKPVR